VFANLEDLLGEVEVLWKARTRSRRGAIRSENNAFAGNVTSRDCHVASLCAMCNLSKSQLTFSCSQVEEVGALRLFGLRKSDGFVNL
jgi:hypothetical protein